MKKTRIAVTGGIGSGKSSVIAVAKNMGIPTFSCDRIYAELILERDYVDSLAKLFPSVVEDGVVNRAKLSSIVFSSEDKLNALNKLAHPKIMQRLYERLENYPISCTEVPLLFEGGYENDFDKILVVMRPLKNRVSSVMERDKKSEQEVLATLSKQFSYDAELPKKMNENVFVLENNGSEEELRKKAENFFRGIINRET